MLEFQFFFEEARRVQISKQSAESFRAVVHARTMARTSRLNMQILQYSNVSRKLNTGEIRYKLSLKIYSYSRILKKHYTIVFCIQLGPTESFIDPMSLFT
jgi:hypothetical protein